MWHTAFMFSELVVCDSITYAIAIDIAKSYHGVQEVYADLRHKGLPGIQ